MSVIIIFLAVSLWSIHGSSLCSSVEYVNKMRNIFSQQSDYNVYEGKLIFRQNASFEYGTNPSGIYGAPFFDNISDISNPKSVGPHSSYFLRSSNALIFSGCTPPKSVYFSFITYILDRFNDYANRTFFEERKMLYASLGAALNNLVWNTNDITKNYDALTTVISTGDNETYNDIYKLLLNNDVSSQEINLETLPNKYIEWLPYKYSTNNIKQYNLTYDTGTFLLRVTMTDNRSEYEQYINTNQTIFILEPKNINPNSNQPRQPFLPFLRNTYSAKNVNESAVYKGILNEYKTDLITFLEMTYNLSYKNSKIFYNQIWERNVTNYGFDCIDQNKNCGGDNWDAQYWQANTRKVGTDSNIFYVILGLMHTNCAIQQTVYSNIIYQDSYANNNRSENPSVTMLEYNGSGLILPVKTNVSNTDLQNIFVVQLTNQDLCLKQLPGFCLDYEDKGLNNDLYIRNYLNPITKTRPNISEILPSILIEFSA